MADPEADALTGDQGLRHLLSPRVAEVAALKASPAVPGALGA
ncbi:hypothetical protein [Streptomyces sp. ERV7]|nr:hypothetical protein [Streptomyces sp. ERV7]